MGRKPLDLLGRTFGSLTVIADTGRTSRYGHEWLCQCECGRFIDRAAGKLRFPTGCSHPRYTGHSDHPIYRVWVSMRQRCRDVNHPQFKDYGGRGITVCERWQGASGFSNFLADMGERPEGVGLAGLSLWTLERIDNDGDYCPENCRWATRAEQAANQRHRPSKKYDLAEVRDLYYNKGLTLAEVGAQVGLSHTHISRLLKGQVPTYFKK